MIVKEKRAKLFQSFSSASQGASAAFLPPIASRPLNTFIQVHSDCTFFGLANERSGLIIFFILFIAVWELLKKAIKRWIRPLLNWIKNKFLFFFNKLKNRIWKKKSS
jgi:hypothetical protein